MANGLFGGGTGTIEDPYIVEDVLDLRAIDNHLEAHFLQVNDIDMQSVSWVPITKQYTIFVEDEWGSGDVEQADPFKGSYDGGNHLIDNMHIDANIEIGGGTDYYGLFHYVEGATIKNLRIENATIAASQDYGPSGIGILAGIMDTVDVANVHVQGECIIERGDGEVINVAGLTSEIWVEDNSSNITNCSVDFKVSGAGTYSAGLACETYGYPDDGFLVNITNCHVEIDAEVRFGDQGGFIAHADGAVIKECSVRGRFISEVGTYGFGGFLGSTYSSEISDCVVDVEIGIEVSEGYTADELDAGFLIGSIYDSNVSNVLTVVHGDLPADFKQLLGYHEMEYRPFTINKVFYDSDRAGTTESSYGTAVTTAALLDPVTFDGWDFTNVWEMTESGPELKGYKKQQEPPIVDIPDEGDPKEEVPGGIVVVTDVNFRETKMLRDRIGDPIPQVWDHENKRWVPVTLQMVLFIAKS